MIFFILLPAKRVKAIIRKDTVCTVADICSLYPLTNCTGHGLKIKAVLKPESVQFCDIMVAFLLTNDVPLCLTVSDFLCAAEHFVAEFQMLSGSSSSSLSENGRWMICRLNQVAA